MSLTSIPLTENSFRSPSPRCVSSLRHLSYQFPYRLRDAQNFPHVTPSEAASGRSPKMVSKGPSSRGFVLGLFLPAPPKSARSLRRRRILAISAPTCQRFDLAQIRIIAISVVLSFCPAVLEAIRLRCRWRSRCLSQKFEKAITVDCKKNIPHRRCGQGPGQCRPKVRGRFAFPACPSPGN